MNNMETTGTWADPAMVEALKALWAEGVRAREIAKRLGLTSKNAVVGKAHRLGLPPHVRKMEQTQKPRRVPLRNKPIKLAAQRRAPKSTPVERLPIGQRSIKGPRLRVVPLQCEPVGYVEREFGQCAYILDAEEGAPLMCCGAPKKEGSSYCAPHHDLCHNGKGSSVREGYLAALGRAKPTRSPPRMSTYAEAC